MVSSFIQASSGDGMMLEEGIASKADMPSISIAQAMTWPVTISSKKSSLACTHVAVDLLDHIS